MVDDAVDELPPVPAGSWELRVHGVAGTPSESMLEIGVVDDPARFPRGVELHRARQVPPHRRAFAWGELTSGRPRHALNALLLPYMLANVGGWMLPTLAQPVEEGGVAAANTASVPSIGKRLSFLAVRLHGFLITSIFVLFAALLFLDVAPALIAARLGPTAGSIGSIVSVGVGILAIVALGQLTKVRPRDWDAPLWGTETDDVVDRLGGCWFDREQEKLWSTPQTAAHLHRAHVCFAIAGFAAVAGLAVLGSEAVSSLGGVLSLVALVLAGLTAVLAVAATSILTMRAGSTFPRGWSETVRSRLPALAIVTATGAMVAAWWLPAEPEGALPGVAGALSIVGFLALLFTVILGTAVAVGRPDGVSRRQAWNGSWLLLLAAALAAVFGAGLITSLLRMLDTAVTWFGAIREADSSPSEVVAASGEEATLDQLLASLPASLEWVALVFIIIGVALLWAAVVCYVRAFKRVPANAPARAMSALRDVVAHASTLLLVVGLSGAMGIVALFVIGLTCSEGGAWYAPELVALDEQVCFGMNSNQVALWWLLGLTLIAVAVALFGLARGLVRWAAGTLALVGLYAVVRGVATIAGWPMIIRGRTFAVPASAALPSAVWWLLGLAALAAAVALSCVTTGWLRRVVATSVVLVGLYAVLCAVAGSDGTLEVLSRPIEVTAWSPLPSLATSVTWLAFVLPVGLIMFRLIASGLRDREARRGLAVIWDLATFWPRWFHPFAQRSYSDTAVTQLSRLIQERAASGHLTVLAPHSQGSIIAAPAILHAVQAGARLPTLALLTYGSPLGHLYRELFPAMFTPAVRQKVAHTLRADGQTQPRWRNLWRRSDPIGGAIFPDVAAGAPESTVDELSAPDGLPDTWQPPRAHSNYWSEPAYGDALDWLWESIAFGAVPPIDPEPPEDPPPPPAPPDPELGQFACYKEAPVRVGSTTMTVLSRAPAPPPDAAAAPGVVLLHELGGATAELQRFADELVGVGFEVHVPLLYGLRGRLKAFRYPDRLWCLRKELVFFTTGRTSRLAAWLAGFVNGLPGGPQRPIGVIGMCMTGGLVLTTLVHPRVKGAIASQPALPLVASVSPHHARADLGLDPQDREAAAASPTPRMCLRYRDDSLCPDERIDALIGTLGAETGTHERMGPLTVSTYGALTLIEVDGGKHSVLTDHRLDAAVDKAIAFLKKAFA